MRKIMDRVPVVKVAWLKIYNRRMRRFLQDEKERRAACLIQRLFRARLLKQLFLVLRGRGGYPNRALGILRVNRSIGASFFMPMTES